MALTGGKAEGMTLEDIANQFDRCRWVYAKTMPRNPHEYTLRREWRNDPLFDEIVIHIREHGYVQYFAGRPYTLLDVGECFYWTMGGPVHETILINRKPNVSAA